MVLDDQMRGKLEKIIDQSILGVPQTVDMARIVSAAKEFQIKNPDDFALGITWGVILRAISECFATMYDRMPSEEERNEISDIVLKRTKEIKEAIFKCG